MFRLRDINNTTLGAAFTLTRIALLLAFTTAAGFSTVASAQSRGEPQVKPLLDAAGAKAQPTCTGNNTFRYYFRYTNGQVDIGTSTTQNLTQDNFDECATPTDGDTDMDAQVLHLSCSLNYDDFPGGDAGREIGDPPGDVVEWAIYRPDTNGGVCGDVDFPGHLKISKVSSPSATGDTFSFTGDVGNFTLQDGDSRDFFVDPGTYNVEESELSGWTLTNIECLDEGAADSSVDVPNATASATLGEDETVTCTFTNTEIQINPAVTIEKSTNGQDADTATGPYIPVGGAVNWAYVVTNTGDVSLTGVSVTDDKGVAVSCPQTTLAIGESMTCTASGTATAGQYANVGRVDASGGGTPVSDTDPSHYFGSAPGIHIEKSTNGQNADNPTGPYIRLGDAVNWSYVVTNTGNVALSGVSVTDDNGTAGNNGDDFNPTFQSGDTNSNGKLDVGETWNYSASGTAAAGQYANVGTASGTGSAGGTVSDTDPSHYFGANPAIDIRKNVEGTDSQAVNPGATVSWTIFVQNTGNVDLVNVAVTDPNGPDCASTIGNLASGASTTYNCSMAGVTAGFTNVATATGDPSVGGGDPVSDSDPSSVTLTAPAIDIRKNVEGADSQSVNPGGTVTWTIVVTNSGNVDLENVAVTDPNGPDCANTIGSLASGASTNYTCSVSNVTAGFTNTASVTGDPVGGGSSVSDSDPSSVTLTGPSIDIEKSTNGQDADSAPGPTIAVGGAVNWSYVVTNTGDVGLTGISVTDDQGVTVNCPSDTLAAGASITCTASGTATMGQYANVGTATGQPDGGGSSVSDTDPSHYFGRNFDLSIVKSHGQQLLVPEGGVVVFTLSYQNTGNVDLTGVVITETVPTNTTFSASDSTAGWTCAGGAPAGTSCTFTVGSVAAGGSGQVLFGLTVDELVSPDPETGECPTPLPEFQVDNTASIVDDGEHGPDSNLENNQDSDNLPISVECTPEQRTPSITIVKNPPTQLIQKDDDANFTITVTNNGAVDLVNVTVDDPLTHNCNRNIGDLAQGASVSYSCKRPDVQDPFKNVATACGEDGQGGNVCDDDDAVVRVLTEEEPPQSIPIPTLSEWALILMAGLMLLLGGRRVKEWTRR